MNTRSIQRLIMASTVSCLSLAAHAADNARTWTLKTDDTHLVLAVRENKLFIDELKNPAQGWNWTPKPSEVPLLAQVVKAGHYWASVKRNPPERKDGPSP